MVRREDGGVIPLSDTICFAQRRRGNRDAEGLNRREATIKRLAQSFACTGCKCASRKVSILCVLCESPRLCAKPPAKAVGISRNRGDKLDSPPNPATCTLVRLGDGLSGQPSETVGGPNLRVLISSLDGDRDFRCFLHLRHSLPTLMSRSNRHETSPRTSSVNGLSGPFASSCWALLVRQPGPNKE